MIIGDNVKEDHISNPRKRKISRRIAIVTSGNDNQKETGFGSIETCKTLYQAISDNYQDVSFHTVSTMESLHQIVKEAPDLAILCSKYFVINETGEKVWYSRFFFDNGIEFSGSLRENLEFDSNKSKAKTLLQNFDVATANFFIAHPGQYLMEADLPLHLPLFVKPLDAANGNGIDENSIVRDFESYRTKVDELFNRFETGALVETELPGREYTIAILDDPENSVRHVIPLEITAPKNSNGDRLLGYETKQLNNEKLSLVPEPLRTELQQVAIRIFDLLGARDFGRIDIKLDEYGKPNFLEANLVPGMTPGTSYFPRALSYLNSSGKILTMPDGMTHSEIARKIVELGLKRNAVSEALQPR
jgi:D-alanine-D-alanine ligase